MTISWLSETKTSGARKTKDVAAGRDHSLIRAQATTLEVIAMKSGIHCGWLPLASGLDGIVEVRWRCVERARSCQINVPAM